MSTHARVATLRAAATSPLVSVLLSTRDGARYLEESLASLAAQSYPNVEIVAVDDGSTDASPEILARFAAAHPRTRLIRTEGIGLAAALHRAAGEATGLLFARQDDDDRSHPERFERQVRHLHWNGDVAVVGTTATRIGPNGETLGPYRVPLAPGAIAAALRRGTPFVHGSVMIRREAYEAAGGYRAAFDAAQDVDLWLRMPREFRFANLDEPLYEWRAHPGGVFARARDQQLFFGAAARAFAEERRARGSNGRDSIALLAEAETTEAFLERYRRRDRVERHWAEALVREGRVSEARAMLRRAMTTPRSAAEAALWWAISWPAGLLPRARRR
ncbi:MAG TPA: glycosyltransferase [Candidatus Eisenbacteria bacterium]|nr:glycosyltransferase [Candidatus Eisenbacteria bacterium]